jgi:pyruvate/2-oxoglutarate/acetoin dehydrogenase E1 component
MREITYVQAVYEALREELSRDESVFIMGEDVELSVYGYTKSLADEFGHDRIRNTPITESAVVGAALGASLMGMRPVVDLMQGNFLYVAMDQFANQAAKARYMFGEQIAFPVVFMAATGAFDSAAAQHSDSPHPMFMNLGGLKVSVPGSPGDAKGLLKAAIRDNNPVMYLMPFSLLAGGKGQVPEGEHLVPLGVADVKRTGTDATVIAIGAMVREALKAAAILADQGIEVEVVDPRTLIPMDKDKIIRSARKTGRVVLVDEARRSCGATSEVAAILAEGCIDSLKAPIRILAVPDVPIPFSRPLEAAVIPHAEQIIEAVRSFSTSSHSETGKQTHEVEGG